MSRALVLLSLSAILWGCTPLREIPVTEEFDGVRTSLEQGNTVSLFVVHGTGGFSSGDPDILINKIADDLKVSKQGEICARDIKSGDRLYGVLERQDYASDDHPHKLRIYTLDWRQASWQEKAYLRIVDGSDADGTHGKAVLTTLKRDFVTNGLGDVALYMGSYGPAMRFPVQQSLKWLLDDAQNVPQHQTVVITISLGGPIVLDSLDALRSAGDAAYGMFVKQIASFFMLSNQVPMMELTKINGSTHRYSYSQAACEARDHDLLTALSTDDDEFNWDWKRSSLGQFLNEKRKSDPEFRIVAMSDPNDIISYVDKHTRVPMDDPNAELAFANVGVRNVTMAWFGKYANPAEAHQGYGQNENVIKMILDGHRN